jgi:hypothetical protein
MNNILDMTQYNKKMEESRYNGRVNVLDPEDPNAKFKMFEKISKRNRSTAYGDALNGVWEDNVLAQVYFSEGNIQIIQNGIRSGVFKKSSSKFNIPPQNSDQLKIIMRSTYLQYAKHSAIDITGQVSELNELVLSYCIPFVYNEAIFYVKYLQDQSTLVLPLEREIRPDREYKQLQMKPWF